MWLSKWLLVAMDGGLAQPARLRIAKPSLLTAVNAAPPRSPASPQFTLPQRLLSKDRTHRGDKPPEDVEAN